MLAPRWRKVLRDLWGHRTRATLVVLSIAVGVFAVGVISTSEVILSRDAAASYAASNPPSATITTTQPFTDDLVRSVRRMPGVREAEGRRTLTVRALAGPGEWRPVQLFALADYRDVRVGRLRPVSGAWPPPDRQVLIERASVGPLRVAAGSTLPIELADGRRRDLRVAGVVHDVGQPPVFFGGLSAGYVTFHTLEWLGEPPGFDQLRVVVSGNALDRRHVQEVAAEVRRRVEQSGVEVRWTFVPEPGQHPASFAIQALLVLLGALGAFSLLLSGFLVANTISALVAQQVRQIGVMKAIGARTSQILALYLGSALVYGLLALAVGAPLGALGASALTRYFAGLVNFDLGGFAVPPQALALEAAVGLAVPLLAALLPVAAVTRLTVREALAELSLGGPARASVLDRVWTGRWSPFRRLPRPLLLSLRNTFRRRVRLALTLATLTVAGAVFVAVLSVRASAVRTLDDALEYYRWDVAVSFDRSYQVSRIEAEARRVPGVGRTEYAGWAGVRRLRPDGAEGDNCSLFALRPGSDPVRPTIVQGRWLRPDDGNALVVNTTFVRNEPDVKVGDEVALRLKGRETTWRVVGVVRYALNEAIVYAGYPYFARVAHEAGVASGVWVTAEGHDAASQTETARALEERFKRAGLRVARTDTTTQMRAMAQGQFDVVVAFLLVMAVLLAMVGGLGLAGTMSLNVLERTREIGVMRAVGASDGAVRLVFVAEGVLIGVLSWLLGMALSVPTSRLLSDAVGIAFLRSPLSYTYSPAGALLWLALAVVLAAVASLLPAWHASRLSVREALAYE